VAKRLSKYLGYDRSYDRNTVIVQATALKHQWINTK